MCTTLKTLLMAMILVGFTAQYAVAENFNNEDMAFAFGDSAISTTDYAQMELLSNEEMTTTEGKAVWFYYAAYYGYHGARALSIYQRYYYGLTIPYAKRKIERWYR